MTRRQKTFFLWFTLALAVASGLGVLGVLSQSDAARLAAFENRFVDLRTLAFATPPGATLAAEEKALTVAWAAGDSGFAEESAPLPLPDSKALQADVYIGGTRNADGAQRYGFRAYLTLTLLRAGEAVGQTTLELPLASDKERTRLYSLRADAQGALADAYTLRLAVEPVDGALAAGQLKLAWLEVTPR